MKAHQIREKKCVRACASVYPVAFVEFICIICAAISNVYNPLRISFQNFIGNCLCPPDFQLDNFVLPIFYFYFYSFLLSFTWFVHSFLLAQISKQWQILYVYFYSFAAIALDFNCGSMTKSRERQRVSEREDVEEGKKIGCVNKSNQKRNETNTLDQKCQTQYIAFE